MLLIKALCFWKLVGSVRADNSAQDAVSSSLRSPGRDRGHHRRLPVSDLSDDFTDPASLAQWASLNPALISSLTVSGGILTIVPTETQTFGWYGNSEGVLLSKTMNAGENFVAEASLTVSSASGGDPAGNWHSAGLLVRSSAGNKMMINIGRQGAAFGMPLTYGTQAMSTISNGSEFGYMDGSMSGRVRICRVGSNFLLMRNLQGDTEWTGLLHQPPGGTATMATTRADLADGPVQVGMMASRWSNAADNVEAEFDYVHFASPQSLADCYVNDLSTLGGPTETDAPTSSPTGGPTPADVTSSPTETPTLNPTGGPTFVVSTPSPTETPTPNPTEVPTSSPTSTFASIEANSDEFFDSTSLNTMWIDEYPDRHSSLEIDDGILEISPSGPFFENVWYDDMHGAMLRKSQPLPSGQDFLVETLVNVRIGIDDLPNGNWHVGGLVMRSANQDDNWVVLNIGLQGPSGRMGLPQTLGVEAKTTTNAYSTFNYNQAPEGITGANYSARLRICRVESEIQFLYRFLGEDGWTIMSPNPNLTPGTIIRTDLAGDVQVGVMTNRMMDGGQFAARFDYVRFASISALADCDGAIAVV